MEALAYEATAASYTVQTSNGSKARAAYWNAAPIINDSCASISFNTLKSAGRAYNAAGQSTVYILLGSEQGDFLDIYLVGSALKDGHIPQSFKGDKSQVEFRAQCRGNRFTQSNLYPTSVNLTIAALNPSGTLLDLPANLVHFNTATYLTVTPEKISIQDETLKHLLADN